MTDLDMEKQHKFWNTQPVVQRNEKPKGTGVIDTNANIEKVRKEPYPLPDGYSWSIIDTKDPDQSKELYDFLRKHYVMHANMSFQFAYTAEFLDWALHPPGWRREWHIGVRNSSGLIVGFISANPFTARIGEDVRNIVSVDFLAVHTELRGHNLAPVLIKEVTRRVNLTGIFEAIFTAGKELMQPFTSAQYKHRLINYEKLCAINFTRLPPGGDMKKEIRAHSAATTLVNSNGFRAMKEEDVPQVTEKLNEYLKKYRISQVFSEEEVKHNFLPRPGIVGSYVFEKIKKETHEENGKKVTVKKSEISSWFSFYIVPSTVRGCEKYDSYISAYIFYYFCKPSEFTDIAKCAMCKANTDYQADVLNCLEICDNKELLERLGFVNGDGRLHYYLFNYALPTIPPEQCGVVLL